MSREPCGRCDSLVPPSPHHLGRDFLFYPPQGMNGYILLAKGEAYNPYGQCGVQIDNQYVTI